MSRLDEGAGTLYRNCAGISNNLTISRQLFLDLREIFSDVPLIFFHLVIWLIVAVPSSGYTFSTSLEIIHAKDKKW